MDTNDSRSREAETLFDQGIELLESGEAEQARVAFATALQLCPNHAKALCARGSANRVLAHPEEAFADCNAALAIDPKYARALFSRGLARFDLGETEAAFDDFEAAIQLDAEAGFYYHRADCLKKLKKLDAAVDDLTTCIQLDSEWRPTLYYNRGWLFSQLDRSEESVRDLEQALRLGLDDECVFVGLAYELSRLKRHSEAVAVLDTAIETLAASSDLLFRRGCALFADNDYESAIRDFDLAQDAGLRDASLAYWRGCALQRLSDYETAIEDYSTAVDRDPTHVDVWVARGESHLDLDNVDESIADLSEAIRLDASKPTPHVLRGRAFAADGNDEAALGDFDAALSLDPSHKKALRARSTLLAELGDLDRSEDDLTTLEEVLSRSSQGDVMPARRTRISLLLSEHFSPLPVADLAITERKFPYRVRADLQRAVNELFGDASKADQFCGVKKEHSYEGVAFSDLLFPTSHSPALAVPPEYEQVDIGEAEPALCLKSGLWFLSKGDLRYAVFFSPATRHGQATGVRFQIAVPHGDEGDGVAQEFFKRLEEAVTRSKSYRGKILSLETNEYYSGMSSGIQVHQLRSVAREQVVLPTATLDLLERNIIKFAQQRQRLNGLGLSTKKGVLFYGPPGTGKTHTIHYLAGAMEGHTTLLISAEQVGLLGEYMTLARLLQPSIVLIEDADLIARERSDMDSVCEEVLLNKLLNEMDGLRPDTDVFFILTTNRPQALEAALASRPGRIDQAIEFPLPDDEGRKKLVHLYAKGIEVPDEIIDSVVERTDKVSASFIKELMRRAAQFHLERDGDGRLSESDVDAALDELLLGGGSLNRTLLGLQCDSANLG